MKFRKKPVVIEAVQWTNSKGFTKKPQWLKQAMKDGTLIKHEHFCFTPARELHSVTWGVDTLEGEMRLSNGDWLIRGIKGELYPCKNEIFIETYEAVEGDLV